MNPYIVNKADEALLNGGPGSILPQSNTTGDLLAHRKIVVKGRYSFAAVGGTIGTISLRDENNNAITLPAGLIINGGLIMVAGANGLTADGSATFDIGIAGGAEFKSGMALSAVDGTNEAALIIPVAGTASTAVVTTAGLFTIKIITANVTAGILDVWLEGYYRE